MNIHIFELRIKIELYVDHRSEGYTEVNPLKDRKGNDHLTGIQICPIELFQRKVTRWSVGKKGLKENTGVFKKR